MGRNLFTNSECENVFAVFNRLKNRYKKKYFNIRPGHTPVVTFMFHNNSMFVLINGKLKETLSLSTLKSIHTDGL